MTINSWTESYGDEIYDDYILSALGRDECYLSVFNRYLDKAYLYTKYADCLGCPFLQQSTIYRDVSNTFTLSTRRPIKYRLLKEPVILSTEHSIDHVIGEDITTNFGEFGIYHLNFTSAETYNLNEIKEPVSIYFPIITVVLIYAAIFSLIAGFVYLWEKSRKKDDTEGASKGKQRVRSLDTFRGISIVLMIFVNYGHGGFPFLEHAIWNGLCVGDLVFPWFMWIMGVCIPMSIKSIKKNGISKSSAFLNILRRSCILFVLGMFLGAGPNLDSLRVFGVLQRFAICYLVVASINILIFPDFEKDGGKGINLIKDILAVQLQWVVMLFVVVGHTMLIFFYQPPDCSVANYLGPGGHHDNGEYMNCTGGVTGYVDRYILGAHVYPYSEIVTIYDAQPFDPEGILGCLTSIFQVFLGVQAGMTMLIYKKHKSILIRWFAWGVVTGLLGAALCGFSKEDGIIPVNKNLWSLSFVLVTSSFAFILLAVCYVLIDVVKIWSGKPFLFAGMNAIVMYVGHNMTYTNFPIHWSPSARGHRTHFTLLVENVQATSVWVIIAYVLYRKKSFYTV